MVLDVMRTCNSTAFVLILPIVKRILLIIQIVAPILLIIMSVVQFTSMINKPDDKKEMKKLTNKILAAVIIFFIPVFINAVMGIVGESTEFSKCWTEADINTKNDDADYNSDGDRKKTPVITDGTYEKGE